MYLSIEQRFGPSEDDRGRYENGQGQSPHAVIERVKVEADQCPYRTSQFKQPMSISR